MKTTIFLFALLSFVFHANAQNLKWSTLIDTSTTLSSPRSVDLSNDGILDIVIGGGLDGSGQSNGVNAINGVDGSALWNFPTNEEIFGSAKFMDITGDGIKDVFIGGRYAEFYAINGSTGNQIWEFFPYSPTVAVDSGWFNFYNAQFIPDQNSDGTPDILVANGGNHAAPPWDTIRDPGMLMVLDAQTGNVLAKDTMPDGEETYCSPVVVDYNGQLTIIYGSGGENDRGGLWRTTLADLMADNLENSTLLASDPSLGFIAPSSIADMNNDGVLDIINQAYDGTIRCFDGSNNNLLWEVLNPGTESSSGPTIGNFIGDATPDVFNVIYKGAAPTFTEFYQVLIDGSTGLVAWKDSLGTLQYGSSSAVDLDMNGRDEVVLSVSHHNGTSFSHEILSIDFQNNVISPLHIVEPGVNLAATPLIEDLDSNGYLDIVFAYRADSLNPMGANGFYLKCLEGTNSIPGVGIAWGSYQGSQQDGHYTYNGTNCGTVTASSNVQTISCNGWADGSVSVTPTSGIAPFSYLWSTGDIGNSIDSLDVGQYTVTVTDSTGCYTNLSFNFTDPYYISFGGILPPLCPGDSNGRATVNSSGCPCMFSTCVFDWDSGDNGKTATSLSSGWQTVTITHMDGCVVVDSVLVPQSSPVLDSVTSLGIYCATNPYGSSSIQLHLHDSVHTLINWNHGDSTSYIDSLDAGLYHVSLHDTLRGCFQTDSILMTAPDTIEITALVTDLTCYNDNSGAINTTMSGGIQPCTYSWSTTEITSGISNLNAGFYSITITDSAGCTAQLDSIEVTQPPQLLATIVDVWDDATGSSSGGAIASAGGGTPPYSYLWNDPLTTANDTLNNVAEGTYTITITDSNGCVSSNSVDIANTLSIHDLESVIGFHPNPTQNTVTIYSDQIDLMHRDIQVFNALGQLMLKEEISSNAFEIDLSRMPGGVYFLSIEGINHMLEVVKK